MRPAGGHRGAEAGRGGTPGRRAGMAANHKFCQVTASSVRAVAAVTWGLECHGRHRDRLERMLLDGGAAPASSRSGKQIRPAESAAPIRLLIHRQFPGWRLPVIGKYPAGIPLERCERN